MNKVIKGLKANEQKVNTKATQVQGARSIYRNNQLLNDTF